MPHRCGGIVLTPGIDIMGFAGGLQELATIGKVAAIIRHMPHQFASAVWKLAPSVSVLLHVVRVFPPGVLRGAPVLSSPRTLTIQ
jgi:hypothetical protein